MRFGCNRDSTTSLKAKYKYVVKFFQLHFIWIQSLRVSHLEFVLEFDPLPAPATGLLSNLLICWPFLPPRYVSNCVNFPLRRKLHTHDSKCILFTVLGRETEMYNGHQYLVIFYSATLLQKNLYIEQDGFLGNKCTKEN